MERSTILLLLLHVPGCVFAQTPPDTLAAKQPPASGDDPSKFISRVELFNEFQRFENFDVNRTVLRTEWKLRRRFSTRLDIPYVYNSFTTPAGK